MKQRKKKLGTVLLAVAVVAAASGVHALTPYRADETALRHLISGNGITVTETAEWIAFEPERAGGPDEPGGPEPSEAAGGGKGPASTKTAGDGTTVILYPGGLVEPQSYAPVARRLAADGYPVYVVKMPLNLPVLSPDRAKDVLAALPDRPFVIGGHSLGGVMAARYAAEHPERFTGVFFLASYPDRKGSLANSALPVLSLTASNDGILNRDRFEQAKQYLPADTVYRSIEGGNHSQFGSYGLQKGDNEAAIPPAEQWDAAAQAIGDWIAATGGGGE